LKGCGLNRDTQSIAFLSSPGIDALYSGDAMTKASESSRRARSASAPLGKPSRSCTSASNDGMSKSVIEARSTVPPFASTTSAASAASRELSDPARSDAEKTRKLIG
jgi:hypothetical protein